MSAIVTTADRLQRLIDRIDQLVAAMKRELGPEPDWRANADYWSFRKREREAEEALLKRLAEEEGARLSAVPGSNESLRMAGVNTSATGGKISLLRNWQNAARRRIEKEARA